MDIATSSRFRRIIRNPFIWAFVIGIISITIARNVAQMRLSAPPPLVHVGHWSLTDHNGKPFGSKELRGKVVIASYFFTRCPTICPQLTRSMKELYGHFDRMRDSVVFVSFSVDPEADTPEVLQAYRKQYGIDVDDWIFLTGTKQEVSHVLIDLMKLHMGDKEAIKDADKGEELYNISHMAEFVLFDQNGDLRGLFKTEPKDLASLFRAAKLLVDKGPSA